MLSQKPEALYEFRCPIHGTINFNEQERRIIDHPFCQRLRNISQLGFASYVYAGATHNRLGHSIGVMHLAGRIFDNIVYNEKKWLRELFSEDDLNYFYKILRIAALLHDAGHPPFSHSSESVLPPKNQLHLPVHWYTSIDLDKQAAHEDFSIAIIYALSEESPALLSEDEAQDVCSLIDHSIKFSNTFETRCGLKNGNSRNIHPLLKNLISGEIDADRMDYLHRDSYYAGVSYGKFDMDRMVQRLTCVQTENGIALVLDHSALYTYENFLLARLHMFLQVYFHKTHLPFDYYLQKALQEHEIDLKINGSLENYLMVRDDSVNTALWSARHRKWSSRIAYRITAKRLFQFEHYHPPELREEMLSLLANEGIEYLFLQSTSYLSMLSSGAEKAVTPLLVRYAILGKTTYLPVQKVSLLLEQYHQNADMHYLYCQKEDYNKASDKLLPFLKSKKII